MTIEWGSVADWVSGLGSLGAVIAALIVAWRENRRADSAERLIAAREKLHENETRRHIAHITTRLLVLAHGFATPSVDIGEQLDEWRKEVDLVARRAERLQRFPSLDLNSFIYLDRLLTLFTSPLVDERSPAALFSNMPKIAERLHIFREIYVGKLKRVSELGSHSILDTRHEA